MTLYTHSLSTVSRSARASSGSSGSGGTSKSHGTRRSRLTTVSLKNGKQGQMQVRQSTAYLYVFCMQTCLRHMRRHYLESRSTRTTRRSIITRVTLKMAHDNSVYIYDIFYVDNRCPIVLCEWSGLQIICFVHPFYQVIFHSFVWDIPKLVYITAVLSLGLVILTSRPASPWGPVIPGRPMFPGGPRAPGDPAGPSLPTSPCYRMQRTSLGQI